jgi:pyridoxamine 5'-phosphate oxidase
VRRDDLDGDPLVQLERWMADAAAAGEPEPAAMTLATVDAGGRPSARIVLLRGLDARGLAFYTNRESRKGRELAGNPHAAVVLHWKTAGRQVRVEGRVEPIDEAGSDAYFAGRPRDSQIGAWASPQSRVVESREQLDRLFAAAGERFHRRDVPRPPHWGGYRLVPQSIEFWQHGAHRMHDRLRYTRTEGGWAVDRLGP